MTAHLIYLPVAATYLNQKAKHRVQTMSLKTCPNALHLKHENPKTSLEVLTLTDCSRALPFFTTQWWQWGIVQSCQAGAATCTSIKQGPQSSSVQTLPSMRYQTKICTCHPDFYPSLSAASERTSRMWPRASVGSSCSTPWERNGWTSPLEGSSAMFDGVGTLEYHGEAQTAISNLSKNPMRAFATRFLPAPEMAKSLAELLSMKQIKGTASKRSRHTAKARTRAKSSASKIIVRFNFAPRRSLWLFDKQTEKKDRVAPVGPTRTPPSPHCHAPSPGS